MYTRVLTPTHTQVSRQLQGVQIPPDALVLSTILGLPPAKQAQVLRIAPHQLLRIVAPAIGHVDEACARARRVDACDGSARGYCGLEVTTSQRSAPSIHSAMHSAQVPPAMRKHQGPPSPPTPAQTKTEEAEEAKEQSARDGTRSGGAGGRVYAEIVEDERQDLQRRAREEGARAAARAAAERAAVALLQMQIVGDEAQGHLRMQLLVQALGETLASIGRPGSRGGATGVGAKEKDATGLSRAHAQAAVLNALCAAPPRAFNPAPEGHLSAGMAHDSSTVDVAGVGAGCSSRPGIGLSPPGGHGGGVSLFPPTYDELGFLIEPPLAMGAVLPQDHQDNRDEWGLLVGAAAATPPRHARHATDVTDADADATDEAGTTDARDRTRAHEDDDETGAVVTKATGVSGPNSPARTACAGAGRGGSRDAWRDWCSRARMLVAAEAARMAEPLVDAIVSRTGSRQNESRSGQESC